MPSSGRRRTNIIYLLTDYVLTNRFCMELMLIRPRPRVFYVLSGVALLLLTKQKTTCIVFFFFFLSGHGLKFHPRNIVVINSKEQEMLF